MSVHAKLPMHWPVNLAFLLLLTMLMASPASSMSDEEWENYWPSDDEKILNAINDGELSFLDKLPEKPVHHHHNTLTVHPSSIDTGWVKMDQCHEHLDKFPRAQILYKKGRIRDLRITRQVNIGQAWVEGHSVQLTNVGSDARLCVQAESRALDIQDDGTFILQNGPFMRKFLDGYFPIRVSVDINLPPTLRFVEIDPVEQTGFNIDEGKQSLHVSAIFEGRLITRIKFKLVPGEERSARQTEVSSPSLISPPPL